jgi:UDP-glucose 4-epimerase
MKVVVTGASGNVGSALVERLVEAPEVDSIVGVCRRPHDWRPPRTTWHFADIATEDLRPIVDGADVVVHLAWLFHPMRAPQVTSRNNSDGTGRLLDAIARTEVPAVVVASSVGAYAPRDGLEPVDESWPTSGSPAAAYSEEKACIERQLDAYAAEHPDRRVVRMRPGFTFAQRSATQQRRLFLGPLVPHALVKPGRVPVLPLPRDLRLQALDSRDVADAYATAVLRPVSGAFNVAADEGLGPEQLANLMRSRWVPTSPRVLRAALVAGFWARAVPVAPALFDLLMSVPVMSTDRARDELQWRPRFSSADALQSFFAGLSHDSDISTPPLARSTSGPLRKHELATGLGHRP